MIVCCGEALIDMLPRTLPDGESVFLPVAGGAIFNTAIALGRLGEECGFVSGISNDMFGEQLTGVLRQSNVSPDFCIRSSQPSTLAFVKLTNGHAEYSFFDENSAGRSITENDLPELPEKVDALHFGAISLIPEPCGSAYEALLTRHAGQCVISLDPNIRPGFIEDAESHRGRISRMAALSDIVKVSDEDLAWIYEGRDLKEAIHSLLENGTRIVLLTKGADGVSAYTSDYNIDLPSKKVEVVDTIGAGDTFNAGFLAGLRQSGKLSKPALAAISREDLAKAVSLANRVAAVTVSRAGANPPWREEIFS